MLNADLKHCQQADGPYLIATTLGAPSSARLLRLRWAFAPRARTVSAKLTLFRRAEPALPLNKWKNNLHIAGCLTLKNKINSFFRTINRKTSSTSWHDKCSHPMRGHSSNVKLYLPGDPF